MNNAARCFFEAQPHVLITSYKVWKQKSIDASHKAIPYPKPSLLSRYILKADESAENAVEAISILHKCTFSM
jgi:hypothetical protein